MGVKVPWSEGAAYMDGAYMPIGECRLPVTDWGFTKSDVTYDVVHVWKGAFFRLDEHIERFQASMAGLRMRLPLDAAGIKDVLMGCVRRSGLRDSYVAMVCTRGILPPGPRLPSRAANRFIAYAVPWVWVMPPEMQERGAHLIVAKTPKIPTACIDPTIKNYHWGDMVRALFEVEDSGADSCVLLDLEGNVTEGPGFNVFAVVDGTVVSPDRGALEGITRRTVFDLCAELGVPARVSRMTAAELRDADEIFCSTTAGGIMPVSRIDGRILGNDRPGPVSLRLKDLYWRKHDQGWHATPVDYALPA